MTPSEYLITGLILALYSEIKMMRQQPINAFSFGVLSVIFFVTGLFR